MIPRSPKGTWKGLWSSTVGVQPPVPFLTQKEELGCCSSPSRSPLEEPKRDIAARSPSPRYLALTVINGI